MKKRILFIMLAVVLALSVGIIGCNGGQQEEEEEEEPVEDVVVGFIGPFATDDGKSGMRGMEIAVEEINANGGILGGRQLKLVKADSAQDITEGIKAYEYLNEVEEVDFIISTCIDDVSLGWMPRLAEYKTPTMDTFTTAIVAIDLLVDEYEKYKSYFMITPTDYFMGAAMIDFADSVLKQEMGWDTTVLFQEDTAYGHGVGDFIEMDLLPLAGITMLDRIIYDVDTVDFAPIFAEIEALDPDFIYTINSVNSLVPCSQYVEQEVPIPMTGLSAAAIGAEFWEDIGGKGAGISTFSPPPALGCKLDPTTQAFIDKYQAKYTTRPSYPYFNGIISYYGLYIMVEAAERAGGFEPLDAWVSEMLNTDYKLYRDGEIWFRYMFYDTVEIDPVFERTNPHACKFDFAGEEGMIGANGVQWYEDGTAKCIYPDKYATGEFVLPPWIE